MLEICCNNLSSKFTNLFSSYLEECSKVLYNSRCGYGGYWDGYDDSYDSWWDSYDDYYEPHNNHYGVVHSCHTDDDDYYPSYRQKSFKKSNKRGVRGGKKHKGVTIYDSDALNAIDDLPFRESKDSEKVDNDITIYFYDDLNNPDNKRVFHSLYDFEEFIDSENIYISSTDQASLLRNNVSHCCKDPNFKSLDTPWLITDSTYGGLRWLCSADEDLYYE